MAIPLLLHAKAVSQVVPIVAALVVWGRQLPAPYRRVVLLCGFLLAADAVDLVVGAIEGNNLYTSFVTLPVEVALSLWLLAVFQPSDGLRFTYGVAIPVLLAGTALALAATVPAVSFDLWISPSLCLLILVAVLHTLVHRSLLSRRPLVTEDWFWICLGLAVHWGGLVAVPAFHRAYIDSQVEWVRVAYLAKAWTNIGAFLIIGWGVVCQRIPMRSFGHS